MTAIPENKVRTTETMLAELVHHMAELRKAKAETNRLLNLLAAGRRGNENTKT